MFTIFVITFIINSIGYLFYKSYFFIFLFFNIIALLVTAPRDHLPEQALDGYLMGSIIFGVLSISCAIIWGFNFKPAIYLFAVFVAFIGFISTLKTQEEIADEKRKNEMYELIDKRHEDYQIILKQQRFKIYGINHLKHYFDIISEYKSAYDQNLLDGGEDGYYPLYDYHPLDCKLEEEEHKYKVFVDVRGWQYVGYLEKTDDLALAIEKMKTWHVEVDGGSTYVMKNNKYRKEWYPLNFTLVIEPRD